MIGGSLAPAHEDYPKPGLLPNKERIEMCRLAIQDIPYVAVNEWETNQDHYSMTLDSLKNVQQLINGDESKTPVQVRFLCGSDLLASFNIEGCWDVDDQKAIFDMGVVCIQRIGQSVDDIIQDNERMVERKDNFISFEDPIQNNMSSTSVRALVNSGNSIMFLTPTPVVEYILDHKLYTDTDPHASKGFVMNVNEVKKSVLEKKKSLEISNE